MLLLATFTILAGAFINHPGAGPLSPHFSLQGLHKGGLYAARLLLITLLSTLFFLTTPPDQAVSLGVRMLSPLRLLGIDGKELSLLVHLAYRFIPLLARELDEMRRGRKARNLTPQSGWASRAREAGDTIVTVVIGALHRAETTGAAMQQRGLLDHWKPVPLAAGRALALWPLLLLCGLSGALLILDRSLF